MTELDEAPTETDTGYDEPPGDELNFITKKFPFQALLEKAASVVPSRDIQPVLRNFLIEAETGKVRVTATDLELSIIAVGDLIVVEKPGSCVLPAAKMLSIVREAADGDMEVEVKDGAATVRVGNARWNLRVADSSEYPPLPEMGEMQYADVDRSSFVSALSVVKYAAARDALKPSYMIVDVRDGRMRASDGIRFQSVEAASVPDMQLPIGAVDDLLKTLKATDLPTISVGQDEHQIVFHIGLDTFVANKLAVKFADVDQVLVQPAMENKEMLQCNRNDLISAIRRVRITADEENNGVALEISKDGVVVSSKDKYGSWTAETMDATWEHEDRRASFNWQHLLEMIQQTEDKGLRLRFGKDKANQPSPVLIEDSTSGAQGILHQLRID